MFRLDPSQLDKLNAWVEEQDKKFAEKQGRPDAYYGCSDGSLTYRFTPTTLGVIVVVRNNGTKEEIDLTNYEDW